jgi:antitoxin PrlF
MSTLTVTSKGQITLKQRLLEHLKVSPGEKVEVNQMPDGELVIRAAHPGRSISDFNGCLAQKGGPRLTIAQIKAITEKAWAGKK